MALSKFFSGVLVAILFTSCSQVNNLENITERLDTFHSMNNYLISNKFDEAFKKPITIRADSTDKKVREFMEKNRILYIYIEPAKTSLVAGDEIANYDRIVYLFEYIPYLHKMHRLYFIFNEHSSEIQDLEVKYKKVQNDVYFTRT